MDVCTVEMLYWRKMQADSVLICRLHGIFGCVCEVELTCRKPRLSGFKESLNP